MLGDLTEKIQASQNKVEALAARIPGYRGYKAREQRREADKLLRLHIARQYEAQMTRLQDIQGRMVDAGQLNALFAMERAVMRLQLLIDRIKTASYGYSGMFDAVKVDEAALDRLYDFDRAMLDSVEGLASRIDALDEAVGSGAPASPAVNELLNELRALNDTFSTRQDVILAM
jgi:hypothetical protein